MVLFLNDHPPKARLLSPVVFANNAEKPKAVLLLPVELLVKAL